MNTSKLRIIRGFNFNYAVSYDGKLCSRRKGDWRQIGSVREDGYMTAVLLKRAYTTGLTRYIHRLIAEAFIPNPDNLPEVNHLDRNKQNNHATNLQWCTHAANVQHSYDTGRNVSSGSAHYLYGKSHSKSTKQAMSAAKKGVNHPKFKGWYVVDGIKYASAIAAGLATGVSSKSIIRWCKSKSHPNHRFKPK